MSDDDTRRMDTSLTLVDRLATQPGEADWHRFVRVYDPLLRQWGRRLGVGETDLDDLLQDTFAAVVRDVADFRRRGAGSFRAWLRGVLLHRAADLFRQRQRQPSQAGSELWQALADPASPLSREWDRQHDTHIARQALRLVEGDFAPPTWRAFRRQVIDGEPAARAAEELGLSLNAVLLAKSRVLARLRAVVAEWLG